MSEKNHLYFGDNLDVLRRYVADELVGAGFYESPWGKHTKIQLLTVAEILKGDRIDMPPAQGVNVTFKKAPKPSRKAAETMELPSQGDGEAAD